MDAYTILDYIKTSIEILMNMKMEENGDGEKKSKKDKNMAISDTESMKS